MQILAAVVIPFLLAAGRVQPRVNEYNGDDFIRGFPGHGHSCN